MQPSLPRARRIALGLAPLLAFGFIPAASAAPETLTLTATNTSMHAALRSLRDAGIRATLSAVHLTGTSSVDNAIFAEIVVTPVL
jgi:hypothetical protein